MDQTYFNKCLAQLTQKVSILPDKPEETPENSLKALWLMAAGNPVSALKAENIDLPELSQKNRLVLEQLIEQRLTGTPLAHLTGRQSFLDLKCWLDLKH